MHGVLESIYYGIPMVGMPVFIDQGDVLRRMLDEGIGVGVDKQATGDELYDAIVEVRDNDKYKKNIDKLSAVFKDKRLFAYSFMKNVFNLFFRIHPQEVAIDFLEFIGRTNGAEHLKVQSGHLNFVQYYCIDVIIFLFSTTSTLIYFIFLLVKRCLFHALLGVEKIKKD